MATRIVQNVLTRPDGTPVVGRQVSIRLNVIGFAGSGSVEVLSSSYATTDDTGMWSAVHEVNADLDPAGTFYTVREGAGVIWTYVVPAGTGPINLRSCLVSDPANPDPLTAGVPLPGSGVPAGYVWVTDGESGGDYAAPSIPAPVTVGAAGSGAGNALSANDPSIPPAPTLGNAGKVVTVKSDGSGYEVDAPAGGSGSSAYAYALHGSSNKVEPLGYHSPSNPVPTRQGGVTPFPVPLSMTLQRLMVSIARAGDGGTWSIALYRLGANGMPSGAPQWVSADIDATQGGGASDMHWLTVGVTLTPGSYVLAFGTKGFTTTAPAPCAVQTSYAVDRLLGSNPTLFYRATAMIPYSSTTGWPTSPTYTYGNDGSGFYYAIQAVPA